MMHTQPPPKTEASLREKLAMLRKREQTLLARTAQLRPEDWPNAEALLREIHEYNEELQPVLAAQQETLLRELPRDAAAPHAQPPDDRPVENGIN